MGNALTARRAAGWQRVAANHTPAPQTAAHAERNASGYQNAQTRNAQAPEYHEDTMWVRRPSI